MRTWPSAAPAPTVPSTASERCCTSFRSSSVVNSTRRLLSRSLMPSCSARRRITACRSDQPVVAMMTRAWPCTGQLSNSRAYFAGSGGSPACAGAAAPPLGAPGRPASCGSAGPAGSASVARAEAGAERVRAPGAAARSARSFSFSAAASAVFSCRSCCVRSRSRLFSACTTARSRRSRVSSSWSPGAAIGSGDSNAQPAPKACGRRVTTAKKASHSGAVSRLKQAGSSRLRASTSAGARLSASCSNTLTYSRSCASASARSACSASRSCAQVWPYAASVMCSCQDERQEDPAQRPFR